MEKKCPCLAKEKKWKGEDVRMISGEMAVGGSRE